MDRRDFLTGFSALGAMVAATPAHARTSARDLRAQWDAWRATPPDPELARALESNGLPATLLVEMAAAIGISRLLRASDDPGLQPLTDEVCAAFGHATLALNGWMKGLSRPRRRLFRRVLRERRDLVPEVRRQMVEKADRHAGPERRQELERVFDELEWRLDEQELDLVLADTTRRVDRVAARSEKGWTSGRVAAVILAGSGLLMFGVGYAAGYAVGDFFGLTLAVLFFALGAILLVVGTVVFIIDAVVGQTWRGVAAGQPTELLLVVDDDHVRGWDRSGRLALPLEGELDPLALTWRRPDGIVTFRGTHTETALSGDVELDGLAAGTFQLELA